ncbi:MAG: thiamine diphosphokinase [Pseudomonadota bacterium]
MTLERLTFDSPVALVGGGVLDRGDLDLARRYAAHFVAADGGADQLAALGQRPDAIVGDLDSLKDPAAWREAGVPVHHSADQDTTDFEKCLDLLAAPLLLCIGFGGARLDHQLAALAALAARPSVPAILIDREEIVFQSRDAVLDLAPGTRVSLFPMATSTGVRSEGLRWSVEGLTLAPAVRVGTSNVAIAGQVRVAFDRPGVLMLLPRDSLDAAVAIFQTTGRAPSAAGK